MTALNNEIKAFIVQALACFDSPTQVATAVKQSFDVVVSRQQVEAHDPTKRCSKGLAKRWVTMFEDTRAGFREAMIEIPVASRSYRLRALGRMVEKAEERGNLVLAAQLIEQAAKESGDMYIRRPSHYRGDSDTPAAKVEVELACTSDYTISR